MKHLVFAAAAALLLVNATPLQAQTVAALPQGDGRDLVAVACSQCHTLSVVMAGRDGSVGWRNHVHNMVLRGAQLTPREADTVLAVSRDQFRPRRAGAGFGHAAGWRRQGAGRDPLRGLSQPGAGHRREAAGARLGHDRCQHVRPLGRVRARRSAGDHQLSRGAVRAKLNE